MRSEREFVIRPSYLPSWQDCPRRTAAKMWPDMIEVAGYELRTTATAVGALVGGGVHVGAAFTLREKVKSGGVDMGPDDEAVERAIGEFNWRLDDEGAVYDQATDNRNTGEIQVRRMTRTYRRTLGEQIRPLWVEDRLEATLFTDEEGKPWILSGQQDVIQEPERLRDLKTGTQQRANHTQYGAYSMIARAHERGVSEIFEDFLMRVPLKKEQPPPVSLPIPLIPAEHEALDVIHAIRLAMDEFTRRLMEGDRPPEGAFPANPQSVLCSAKYCPAHGTKFCRVHRGAE